MSVTIDVDDDLCITIEGGTVYVSSAVKMSRQALVDRVKRRERKESKRRTGDMARNMDAIHALQTKELTGDVL